MGTVLIGDVIDLDNLVVAGDRASADGGDGGRWSAEPSSMANVVEDSGVAVVLRAGALRFSYFPAAESSGDGVGGGEKTRQRTTLDVSAETPARLALAPTQLLARRPTDQFVPFVALRNGACEQECNFHGVAAKKGGEADADSTAAIVTTDLFECHARFLSGDTRLEEYFDVQAVFNFKIRYYLLLAEYSKTIFWQRIPFSLKILRLPLLPSPRALPVPGVPPGGRGGVGGRAQVLV